MPKYSAKLTNGKTITLEGDEQPSDADFEEAAHGAGVTLLPAQPPLSVMPHAATIQQDPSGPVKRAIDTAMYEAKGVPGMLAGGVKNIVGGVNSVMGLVHGPQIPIDTEPANLDQRMGDVGMTAAQLIPAGMGAAMGAVKGTEAAVPVAARVARAVAPVAGGVAGATEGYRQHGVLGAVEGGIIGTAGGGFLGRVMRKVPLGAVEKGASVADEASAALREATRVNDTVTPQDVQAYSRGRVQAPPVAESLRSQGSSLLSPEADAARAHLDVTGPSRSIQSRFPARSVEDFARPEGQAFMNREFAANNPIYQKMAERGTFGDVSKGEALAKRGRLNTRIPEVVEGPQIPAQAEPTAADVESWTRGMLEPSTLPKPPEPPAPVKIKNTVSTKTTVSKLPMEQRYEQLSAKQIRTPDEELEFQNLDRTMRATGARNRGKSYATRGK